MNKIPFALLALLSGCASTTGVISAGKDQYMIAREDNGPASSLGAIKAEAFQEANAYCTGQGKSLQVVSTQEARPPFVFGNSPKAEVQFMCLNGGDAELGRPKLKPKADVSIEVKNAN